MSFEEKKELWQKVFLCRHNAKLAEKKGDMLLYTFYVNAGNGFKERFKNDGKRRILQSR